MIQYILNYREQIYLNQKITPILLGTKLIWNIIKNNIIFIFPLIKINHRHVKEWNIDQNILYSVFWKHECYGQNLLKYSSQFLYDLTKGIIIFILLKMIAKCKTVLCTMYKGETDKLTPIEL